MNRVSQYFRSLRSHPARTFLVLFLLMIGPAIGLYPWAKSGNEIGMGFFLALVILANIAAIFF